MAKKFFEARSLYEFARVASQTSRAAKTRFLLRSANVWEKIRAVKKCFPKLRLCTLAALALAAGSLIATGADDASRAAKPKKKITEPTSTLEGYFVRVKSAISGEKELYYNKDGTLRTDVGSGLLEGNFSLDESLLGDDGGFPSEEIPSETTPAGTDITPPDPAAVERSEIAPETEQNAPPAPAPVKRPEPDGVVDEHSILKKFSKENRDFGIAENFRKTIDMTHADFAKAFSMKEWKNATSFGMRHFIRADEGDVDMRAFAEPDGLNVPGGNFSAEVSPAGNRMFVRRDGGLYPVKLNGTFSNATVRENERSRMMQVSSGLSMQDINRYQFRRNRSTDPGLPVVSPGGNGNVRRENFGGKNSGADEK